MDKQISFVLELTAAFAIWGALHSLTAGEGFKRRVAGLAGADRVNRWYRLAYNLVAVITFLPLMAMTAVGPDTVVYRFPAWLVPFTVAIQLVMAGLLVWSVRQTGMARFLGFAAQSQPASQPVVFVSKGLYGLVRHPIYTTSLLALWLAPVASFASITFALLVTLYILIGVQFEERRLEREFGEQYAEYKRQVPMLIPFPLLRK